ncbi:MAG TPA: peptide chain release factor 1 [Bdellovibrionales bacterium]|nr:peptide chain release factor 1 [Bdellovibrionales bacterium]
MFDRLNEVESRYESLSKQLQEPDVISDQKKYKSMMKEYSDLGEMVATFREYKKVAREYSDNKELLETEKDESIRQMAKEELGGLEQKKHELEEKLKVLLLPKDPNDDKNIILEIRPAAGGDEAGLFADELFRAYSHFASKRGWSVELLSLSAGAVGGIKEVVASISGDRVYSQLKYESGVHRVQRVPKTEAQGRVHTSTVTVAVLPEAEEVDVHVDPKDVRVDTYRAGGAGGQHVNKTDSAVRLTHIPTGLVIQCQDEKSQIKNRSKAFKILYARLLALQEEKSRKEASDARLAQIGTGDRSERIRTYNFPQSRITDHRIGLTIHQLNEVMEGAFELVIEPLTAHYQAEALKQQTS